MSALVTCWNCKSQYAGSMGDCPACAAEFIPTEEELVNVATDVAVQLFNEGYPWHRVNQIVAESYFDLEHEEIVEVLRSANIRIRNSLKAHGRHVATTGSVLIAIGLAIYLFFPAPLLLAASLVLSGGMFLAGTIQARTGWNLLGPWNLLGSSMCSDSTSFRDVVQ